MKRPTLCLIVPNYNHSKYLPRSLDSILQQSWQPDEIIVVDDGSTDNSVEVIDAYRQKHPKIRLIRNERNQGVLSIINRGWAELTQAEYVHFPAADDELSPGLLEKSMSLLAKHPQAALSCAITDLLEVDTGLNWHLGVGIADSPCYLSPRQLVDLEKRGRLFISSTTIVWRRESLRAVGGFLEELKWRCDWFTAYVAAFRDGICYVPEPLAVFHVHPNSYYKSGRRNKAAHRAVLERIMELLASPEFAKEGELIREGGSLYQFAGPMFSVLWRNKNYRRFITPTFLRKNLWYSTRLFLKPFTPASLGNLYFKIAGLRARSSAKRNPPPRA